MVDLVWKIEDTNSWDKWNRQSTQKLNTWPKKVKKKDMQTIIKVNKHRNPKEELQKPWVIYGRVSKQTQKSKRRAAETLSDLRKGEWKNTEIQKKSCRNLEWPTEGWVNKHRNPKEELQKHWVTLSDLRKGEQFLGNR